MNLQGPRSSSGDERLARLAAERADADRRYNDALTALDRAIVDAGTRESLGRGDLLRMATTLIGFLQQITAFVETKDRELAASTAARIDGIERTAEAIAELRTQMGVVQRTVAALSRELSRDAATLGGTLSHASPAAPASAHDPSARGTPARTMPRVPDVTYVAFEDHFRGADETIRERLAAYVPLFAGAADVVDIGCGRGEFLAALKAAGISGRGVDLNAEMAAIARDRGLDVQAGDALAFLASLPDGSLGGLMAAQVVEHLEPSYLVALLETAAAKLRPGAPIVIETINAACWLAFFSSYIRDLTHVRPIHPETLQYLLRATGFERVMLRYSAPVPEHVTMQPAHLPAETLASADSTARALVSMAHTFNANMAILNNLMFTHLDYAAIGYCS